MIPSILLALTIIIAMIDVLVGIHRGFGFGFVRFLIWAAGAVVCIFLARPVTIWLLLKVTKVPDMRNFVFEVFGRFLGENKESIGTHLAGTTVSFMVPVVFVALFIISKLITWIIYLLVKQLIKKAAKRAEAHNAAFDAVKAIEHMETIDEESLTASPIPQPSFNDDKPADFGTFGIFPKDEAKETGIADSYPVEANDTAEAEVGTESGTGFGAGAETETDIETKAEAETQTETAVFEDGFEAIAASSEDGFESLARDARLAAATDAAPKKAKPKKNKPAKPVKPKKLKRSRSLSLLLMKQSVANNVLGGILGLFISLLACAIIMIPVTEVFNTISEKEDAEAVVDLAFTVSETDAEGLIDNAFEKGSRPIPFIQKEIELTSDISIRSQDFVEMFTDGEKSIVYNIYKYSGANAVASFIYDRLVTVDIQDIGLDNKGFKTYNFQDTVKCYLGMAKRVNNLISVINEGKGISNDLIFGIKDCLDFIIMEKGKGEILTQTDKLALVNNLIDSLNKRLEQSPIMQQSENGIILIDHFSDYNEMKTGLENMFDLVKRLISAGILE